MSSEQLAHATLSRGGRTATIATRALGSHYVCVATWSEDGVSYTTSFRERELAVLEHNAQVRDAMLRLGFRNAEPQ